MKRVLLALVSLSFVGCGIPGEEEIANATTEALDEDSTEAAISDAVSGALADAATQAAIEAAVADALADEGTEEALANAIVAALTDDTSIEAIENAVEIALARVALAETIAAAKGMVAVAEQDDLGLWTPADITALNTAIAAAEVVDDDSDSTLAEVKDANEALVVEMAVFGSQALSAAMAELQAAVTVATQLLGAATAADVGNLFTSELTDYQDAIDDAQGVLDDPYAGDGDAEDATDALDGATDTLCSGIGSLGVCP